MTVSLGGSATTTLRRLPLSVYRSRPLSPAGHTPQPRAPLRRRRRLAGLPAFRPKIAGVADGVDESLEL
ncbi:hypothetical protein Nepgr_027605 [Nepenthes gracilis]|uniref:Uncharacterized protein n=1 Tax=Nepenthes gracilis TaxID=150966 RepID=A0AAD3TAE1_NEPGR|nr:hypothetical protein Nepgr_027605 [Nepenthes gracilis]